MTLHPEDIFYVFLVEPNKEPAQRKLLAKYAITSGKLSVLEDHGLGVDLEHMEQNQRDRYLQHLASSQRTEVVSLNDVLQGNHEGVVKPTEDHINPDSDENQPLKLKYDHPQLGRRALEIHGNAVYLDGHKLTDEEVQIIMNHAKSGEGRISHTNEVALEKAQPELYQALGHLKEAVRSGAVQPEAYKILSRHIFKDTMVPSVGNKLAYEDFMSRPRPGYFVHMDMDNFGQINKQDGYSAGDKAIKTAGAVIRAAVDESVGRKQAKCWRPSGDEFFAYFPSKNHAEAFVRVLKTKMAELPLLNNWHQFSVTAGGGPTAESAAQSLVKEKQRKKQENQLGSSAALSNT